MNGAPTHLRVQVVVVSQEAIEVSIGRVGCDACERSRVRDIDAALDRLEIWLRQPTFRADQYDVTVTGADGAAESEVSPNRHLALYFIAMSLSEAVARDRRQPTMN